MSREGGWRVEPGSTHTHVSGGGGGAVCSPSVLAIIIQQPQRMRPGSWWLLLTWGQEVNSYVVVWMMFKHLVFQMRAPTAGKGGQGARGGRRTCAQVWGLPCRRAVAGRAEREVGRSSLLETWCSTVGAGLCVLPAAGVRVPELGGGGRAPHSSWVLGHCVLSPWAALAFSPSKTVFLGCQLIFEGATPLSPSPPETSAVTCEASHLTLPGFGFFMCNRGGGLFLCTSRGWAVPVKEAGQGTDVL